MAMSAETKRQGMLLGLLCVAVLAYFQYGGVVSFGGSDIDPEALPSIDAASLERSLQSVSTVSPGLMQFEKGDSVADRNLFQYGQRKPPPPDPAELERQRLAAQKALEDQEARLRAQREQERLSQEQRQQQVELQERNLPPPPPPVPAAPREPEPPAITFRLMGVFGHDAGKIGVLVEGDNPPLLAKKGEIVHDKFRIIDVGVQWVDVGFVDPRFARKQVRISLGS